ncbi:MAG: fibronectin type III domain-containing protein [Candidatus Marinimicrobia bacterium]|nr:fibronectin type III domain-containing protein [Candidatus Neomarinimicrobiota bacterium]
MNYKILLIAFIISGYFGCEDLEHTNPVDPNVNITAPNNLQLSQQNIHTVLLSWNFSGDKYNGYLIDRKIGSDSWQIAYDTVACEIHSYTDTSAVPTESHTYRIYSYADENQSSSISKDITLVFPAPENLQLTQLSDTTVALQWQDKSDGEDGFIINRKKDSGTWETEIKKTTATTWTDSTVSPGSAYSYQVKAFRGIKTSPAVESQYQNIFQAPSNLSAAIIDDQSLRLTWTDNCSFESGYRVERNDGSGFIQITELNANVTTYKDEGLTYGQSYSYRIKTYTSQNESDYSNELQIEMVIPAPSNFTATLIDDQSVQLIWDDNCTFEAGYVLERKEEDGAFNEIADLSANTETYTDQGLTGINYTYRIRAYTNVNISDYCEEIITNMNVVYDIDGNAYKVVKIGDQWWMAENLKVIHYRNGDAIPNVTNNNTWISITTGAYCNYNNDESYVETYGRMYNWYSAVDSRNIAPEGWHVPSVEEWQTFIDYLGGDDFAGGKLKEPGTDHWLSPNTGATNSSGFTALPAGLRGHLGEFFSIGEVADFWCLGEESVTGAWNRVVYYNTEFVKRDGAAKCYGFSIRCVKD